MWALVVQLKQDKSVKDYNKKSYFHKHSSDRTNIYFVQENENFDDNPLFKTCKPLVLKLNALIQFIKTSLKLDETYVSIPGILITKQTRHQRLHLDFEDITDDPKDVAWILHMPLCKEGMWLNIISITKHTPRNREKKDVKLKKTEKRFM